MAGDFPAAKELYETALGYLLIVAKGEIGLLSKDTIKKVEERINEYMERVEEIIELIEGNILVRYV